MTPKQHYKKAYSLIRYDSFSNYYCNDYASKNYDLERDIYIELGEIPNKYIGAAYRSYLESANLDPLSLPMRYSIKFKVVLQKRRIAGEL